MNTLKDSVSSHEAALDRGVLDSAVVAQRWKEIGDSLARLMTWMDSQEVWLQEGGDEDLDTVLNQLIDLSERESWVREMHKPFMAAALAELLAWVASSRFFRLLEVMDRNSPNFVNRFALALGRVGGDAGRFADLFFERVMVVHRGELLGRVFGENRTNAIAETIRTIRETRHE
ncbi:hypothetical protein D3C77_328430 [compost metagenome]